VDAIRETWSLTGRDAVKRWLQLAVDLEAQGEDVDALFAYLELEQPAVFGLIHAVENAFTHSGAWYQGFGNTPIQTEQLPPKALSRSLFMSDPWANPWDGDRRSAFAWEYKELFYVVPALSLWMLYGDHAAALAVGVILVPLWIYERLRANPKPLQQRGLTTLTAFAKNNALFPHEAGDAVATPAGVTTTYNRFTDGHPLLEFERDPAAVLKCLTQAHVDRFGHSDLEPDA